MDFNSFCDIVILIILFNSFHTNKNKHNPQNRHYKYEWKSEDELVLYAVGEEFTKANYEKAEHDDTKTLRAFIEAHIDKEGLFEDGLVFVRDDSGAYKKLKN